ncbi:hypothetical protein AVT69_gp175 [Pseudomonas phage PhiPA3]|uniref:Uncharacterized protein 177 n=1 Tax=Pseudomonas phage PhiPA3 TaxID=998086 RepID=F8SJL6_BPPA3|nr:hypothetical protein AVT69_gp175 [Pseudomonas phage PhiPA3]AEH03600.1 hypothetical protein [Pseudomonas phage PhiPA3]
MSITNRIMRPVRKVAEGLWLFFWNRVDDDLKRLCVMASLHAALVQCRDHECSRIARLNSTMRLVRDESALRLPTLFGPYLWKGILPIDKNDLTSEKFYKRIARKTPCWLLYTDECVFIEDLKQLMQFCMRERREQV